MTQNEILRSFAELRADLVSKRDAYFSSINASEPNSDVIREAVCALTRLITGIDNYLLLLMLRQDTKDALAHILADVELAA